MKPYFWAPYECRPSVSPMPRPARDKYPIRVPPIQKDPRRSARALLLGNRPIRIGRRKARKVGALRSSPERSVSTHSAEPTSSPVDQIGLTAQLRLDERFSAVVIRPLSRSRGTITGGFLGITCRIVAHGFEGIAQGSMNGVRGLTAPCSDHRAQGRIIRG